jgi:Leucine-rich repeat (LRR) protein
MFELRCFAENGEQSKYLQRLDLSYMKVVTLPQELPGGLRELDLRGTHLLRLPKLPNSLQKLDLSGSLVSESDPPSPKPETEASLGSNRDIRRVGPFDAFGSAENE